MQIFDTHAHYDDEQFDADRDNLLMGLQAAGVGRVVNIGASMRTSANSIDLSHRYPFVYAAVGVHPNEVEGLTESDMETLKQWAKDEKCVAIGEIGLDYFYDEPPRDIQKVWFERQLDLAKEINKPVVIHSRDAVADTLDIMKAGAGKDLRGVIHCFSYSLETAKEFLNWDYCLGVGGVITFKNGRKLREVVEAVPLDRLVLETDCPYLCPDRGHRNDSSYINDVVRVISEIKNADPQEIIDITWNNACRLYGMQ